MWIKNNSNREWLDYKVGGTSLDIKARTIFQVEDSVGRELLSLLGSSVWLTKTEEPVKEKKNIVKKKINKKFKKNNKSKR